MYFYNCVIDIAYTSTLLEQDSMTGTDYYGDHESDDVIDIDSKSDLNMRAIF